MFCLKRLNVFLKRFGVLWVTGDWTWCKGSLHPFCINIQLVMYWLQECREFGELYGFEYIFENFPTILRLKLKKQVNLSIDKHTAL